MNFERSYVQELIRLQGVTEGKVVPSQFSRYSIVANSYVNLPKAKAFFGDILISHYQEEAGGTSFSFLLEKKGFHETFFPDITLPEITSVPISDRKFPCLLENLLFTSIKTGPDVKRLELTFIGWMVLEDK